MTLEVKALSSLSSFTEQQLERLTEGSGVFLDWRWLRMAEAVELEAALRGPVRLIFVVATEGGAPVGLCPVLVIRQNDIYRYYSVERSYFTGAVADLHKLMPRARPYLGLLDGALAAYRLAARALGAPFKGWVLGVSPMSLRSDLIVRADTADDRARIRTALVDHLKALAAEEGLPLCLLSIEAEAEETRSGLIAGGFSEVFLFYDTVMKVPGSFDGYLERFRSDCRYHIRKELKRADKAGLKFTVISDLEAAAGTLADLYESTQSRYGRDHVALGRDVWAQMGRHLGDRCRVVVAQRQDKVLGFSLLLHKGDLYQFKIGRQYSSEPDDAVYFSLSFYEPLRQAIALGAPRLWFGTGAYETKRRRGGVGSALYSYFWYPGRVGRVVALPYLQLYSRLAQQQLAFATRPSSWLKA